MLKSINNIYIIASLLLFLVLSPKITGEYLFINILTLFTFITYYSILQLNSSINKKFYTKWYLWVEVFLYSLFFVAMYNILSYYYRGNFFTFNESDAVGYHYYAIKFLNMPLSEAIRNYLHVDFYDVDDLGIVLLIYPLYYIVQSNLILNFFYLFVGTITALSIFSIGKNFMTRKYAFLSALAYTIASFTLFFHSTSLKESFMVMLVILSFDFYYRFQKSKNIGYIIGAIIFVSLLLLFRSALLAMVVGSIGLGAMVSKGGVGMKVFSIFILLVLISMGNFIYHIVLHYMGGGGFDQLVISKESRGMVIGGLPFTYAVNTLAQAVGPLPSIVSSNPMQVFYSAGLLYRVLLGFPFWMGIIYIYKTKKYILYPLAIFVLSEMLALTFLMEGLECRKSMTHIPFVFIIAFWFLDQYDRKVIQFKKRKKIQRLFKFSSFILILLILYWNFK